MHVTHEMHTVFHYFVANCDIIIIHYRKAVATWKSRIDEKARRFKSWKITEERVHVCEINVIMHELSLIVIANEDAEEFSDYESKTMLVSVISVIQ